ncbi:MAG: hypothetical protein JO182_31400 [Acidobacteriaceae bacterium]|nr:hypothetical protein [Acidobacteriaceae bacterium]MBV9222557.1 hypothetical protein [Acidobacteriaceae bacterium]
MGGQLLTNREAWNAYDGFLADDQVRIFPELQGLDNLFRSHSSLRQSSPKVWVDAYLAAHAAANEAILVTFLNPVFRSVDTQDPSPTMGRC